MSEPASATVNLQWKGIDACYDFYCSCNPHVNQHRDGGFQQWFTCGKAQPEQENWPDRGVTYCGKSWWIPNHMDAVEVSAEGEWPSSTAKAAGE